MNLNKWFDKGITTDQYIKSLENHKEGFETIYENFSLPHDDDFFQSLEANNLRVLVLAEPWCGHCMLNIPLLLHLTEKINMPIRFLHRDDNLELMDQFLTNGNRTIPIFIFIDNEGNEVAKWGPIASSTKAFTEHYRKELPEKDDPQYDVAFKKMITITSKAFREDKKLWNGSYESMKKSLSF